MRKSIHSDRYEKFCALLIEARKEAGMTQVQVAEALGQPQSFISKYELGERRLDVIEFLEIAEILKIDSARMIKKL